MDIYDDLEFIGYKVSNTNLLKKKQNYQIPDGKYYIIHGNQKENVMIKKNNHERYLIDYPEDNQSYHKIVVKEITKIKETPFIMVLHTWEVKNFLEN